jgi:hypothetical protein
LLKVLSEIGQKSGDLRLEGSVIVSDRVDYLGYLVVHVTTLVHPLGNSAVGIHHGGVVAIAENLTDLG